MPTRVSATPLLHIEHSDRAHCPPDVGLVARRLRQATAHRIKVALTHDEIGQIIGMSRETVTRTLATFRKQQIAELHGSTLLIQNMTAIHNAGRSIRPTTPYARMVSRADKERAMNSASSSTAAKPPLILCIDDADIALRVRKLLLGSEGYNVLTAEFRGSWLGAFQTEPRRVGRR